jgi:hypothetical protein
MRKLILLVLIAVIALPAVYSLTASIGNARAIIRVNASPENPAILERTILVQNKNEIPVKVALEPSKEFEKFVTIIDKEFELQPGQQKNAEFIVTIDRGGTIDGKILVGFSPADPESKENNVGLSSTLIIISDGPIIEEQEEEEEEEEIVEEVIEIENENPEVGEEVTDIVEDQAEEPADQKITANAVKDGQGAANPAIGILIIAVIVGIGALGIFATLKIMKKND